MSYFDERDEWNAAADEADDTRPTPDEYRDELADLTHRQERRLSRSSWVEDCFPSYSDDWTPDF